MDMIISENNENEFIRYLTSRLNENEEKQFCINFSLYLKYTNNINEFPIDFDIVWKLLGFTRKNTAYDLLKKYFKENIDYKILLQFCLHQKNNDENNNNFLQPKQKIENRGGHNKETIMLNVMTFKKFCLKASTKEADNVINYYIKLENIFFDYTNEKLLDSSRQIKKLENNVNKSVLKQNKIFKDSYNNKKVIYLIILQEFDNNSFILKIGHTDDIKNRMSALSCQFNCNNLIIKDVFECENNNKFEQFLHNHNEIIKYKYNDLINNKIKSTETYLLSNEEQYNKIKKIIELNIINYNSNNLEELELKNEMYRLRIREKEIDLQLKQIEIENKIIDNYDKIDNIKDFFKEIRNYKIIENNEDNTTINFTFNQQQNEEEKYHNPYIQCYDIETKKLVKTFNSITEATREIKNASYSQIKHAAKFNKVYLNYRWVFIYNKEDLEKEIEDIGETTIAPTKTLDMVVLLNIKDEILNVFINQKEAAEKLDKCPSYINTVIKNKKIFENKKLILWNELSEEIKNKYLETNELPILQEKLKGIKINKINPETNEILYTYLSITDLIKVEKISPKTIKKAITLNKQYNGFLWNYG